MPTRKTTVFYMILIALASVAIGMVLASRLELSPRSSAETMVMPQANSAPIGGAVDALTFRNIAKMATPAVVNVRTTSRRRSQELTEFFGGDDFFRRFFGQPGMPEGRRRGQPEVTQGAGTGFIIDKAGLILTNNHVVEGATQIEVGLYGTEEGPNLSARLIGRDPLTDSALIELTEKPRDPLPVAKFGDSDQIQPGDWVMAIGNPFNFSHTVTVGVVSATERPFPVAEQRWQNVIQTDAAINPGNSGGPLLNIRGEVIGINTAIVSGSMAAGNLGIGFAVPINVVRELLPQLRGGKITRGRIGVSVGTVAADAAAELGLKERAGALVSTVESDGPAAKAGVQPGDVIIEYNGKPVKNRDELVRLVVATKPGSTVPIKIVRDKQPKTLNVMVEELNLESEGQESQDAEGDTSAGFGITLEPLSGDLARRLRVPSGRGGAVISNVEAASAAQRAGLQRGDVILQVNRREVSNVQDSIRELQKIKSGGVAFLLIWRGNQEVFVTVRKE
jgi:serine protease Do